MTDVIALAASTTPGIVELPLASGGAGAFAVATINVGAPGTLTVSVDTGSAQLPLATAICQTNSTTGQCLAPPSATVSANFTANGTPTFAIFATATGQIPFAPGSSRIFVRFKDGNGVSHGSTSEAVETD